MPTDATKKYREHLAFGLLAVAALWFVGSLSLLLKSSDFGFAAKSAAIGGLFEAPIAVFSLVLAVLLVTRFGEPSRNARVVVLVALGIGALNLLFAIISFFAQFGANIAGGYEGIGLAGKGVGALLGLAALIFLVVAVLFMFAELQGLPSPVAAQPSWGAAPGGYGSYGYGAAPTGQQAWGQPSAGTGQGPQPYGAGQGYPQGGQPTWGQQPGYGGQAPAGSAAWAASGGQRDPGATPWPSQGGSAGGWGAAPGSDRGYAAPAPGSAWDEDPSRQQDPWVQPTPTYGDGSTDSGSAEGGAWGDSGWSASRSGWGSGEASEASELAPASPTDTSVEAASGSDSSVDGEEQASSESDHDTGWWQHPGR